MSILWRFHRTDNLIKSLLYAKEEVGGGIQIPGN